jgi:argininosuccinate synthase
MKSHGLYETPGGSILMFAHADLQSITLDRDTQHYSTVVAERYSELVYNGQWFSPLCSAMNKFFEEADKNTTGTVKLKLYKGNIISSGRKAKYSLYSEKIASFGDVSLYDHKDATGFIRCFTLPNRVRSMMEQQVKESK